MSIAYGKAERFGFTPPQASSTTLTTTDTTAPTVVSFSGSVDGPLTIVFSEPVRVGAGSLTLTNSLLTPIESIDLAGPAVAVNGNTVTIDPGHVLAVRTYSLRFSDNAVTDLAGNGLLAGLFIGPMALDTLKNGDAALSGYGDGYRVTGTEANTRDTAIYLGSPGDFTFTATVGGHSAALPDGRTMELSSVERVLFTGSADAMALSLAGNLGQVYRLYQAAFDRTPDKIGFGFWLSVSDAGHALTTIAQEFIDSREFADLYGANTGNAEFVAALYDNVLHREGDPGGVAFWNRVLDDGVSRAHVLTEFAESAENRAQVAELIGNGFAYTPYG